MILVTGATGTVGRPLIDTLRAAGVSIRAVSRTPHHANLPSDVEIVHGDPSQPETLIPFLRGIQALFLHPRAVGDAATELLIRAREHGVRRVVVLSAINVDDPLHEQPSRFRGDRNKEVEAAALASGMEWVSLRSDTFAINTLGAWGDQIRAGDSVRGPYPNFAEPPIHERDLAEVAAHALFDKALVGHKLDLTGPESLTHTALITTIGEVVGRPLHYQAIPPEIATRAMVGRGFPEPFVTSLLARYARGDGKQARITNTVQQVLGRPARTYAQWVADHRADFGS